jgi:hypothetical protein
VVGHDVDDQPDAARRGVGQQCVEVAERAETRVDVDVVSDVVPAVVQRRGVERGQPDRVDAEVDEVIQVGAEAGEVSGAVMVAVGAPFPVDFRLDVLSGPRHRILGGQGVGPFRPAVDFDRLVMARRPLSTGKLSGAMMALLGLSGVLL